MSDVFIDEFETNRQWKENHSHEQQDKIDAARYRFLRDPKRKGYWRVQKWEVTEATFDSSETATFEVLEGKELDEEIDAARLSHDGKDGL